MKIFLLSLLVFILPFSLLSQKQYADSSYSPPPFQSKYAPGVGPIIYIDEAHHNFHTKDGRYMPFAHIAESDGYRVEAFSKAFSSKSLSNIQILVIANALPLNSVGKWVAPTESAFTDSEIKALKKWVLKGGKLFLIADHMPFGGAARKLASAFDYKFYDSFADDTTTRSGQERFMKYDQSLSTNEITMGRNEMFEVDSVTSFTGQAFQIPAEATSILNCGPGWVIAMPDTAWQFNSDTRMMDAEGWSQGAFEETGKGKVVIFGEAAMFSAQIAEIDSNTFNAGMNSEAGKNNYRLLLNIIRWLDQ